MNFSTCIADEKYNQYECYANKIKERISDELKCLFPFQVYNNMSTEKNICGNMTDLEGKNNYKI